LGVLAWQTGLRGGFLWQLVPLVPVIAAPLLPAVLSAVPWPSSGPAWWATWGVGWLLAAASLAALLAFPPVPFPPRTAPRTRDLDAASSGARSADRSAKLYDVGFRHGEEDEGDERGRRAFYVWYPAARGSRTTSHKSRGDSGTSHYFPQFTSQMEAMFESMQYRLPTALLFSHLRYVHPDTLADAPLLPAPCAPSTEAADDGGPRWPAIVFSHGLYGFPSLYTHLCSSLASLGYVVVWTAHHVHSRCIVMVDLNVCVYAACGCDVRWVVTRWLWDTRTGRGVSCRRLVAISSPPSSRCRLHRRARSWAVMVRPRPHPSHIAVRQLAHRPSSSTHLPRPVEVPQSTARRAGG
jgi:hypothetical protein